MKLEVIVIPVSDLDRAKEFYRKLGWRLNADYEAVKTSACFSSRRRAREFREPVSTSDLFFLQRTFVVWS